MNRLFRRTSSMIFAGAVILATAACTPAAGPTGTTDAGTETDTDSVSSETIRIGYAPQALSPQDFFGMFELGLRQGLEAAGRDYEIISRVPSNQSAHEEQFTAILDLITLEVDVIVVAPTEYEAQIGAFQAVNEAGIPLFITNLSRPAIETPFEVVQYAAYSHEEGGIANGEWFAANLDPGTQVGIIRGIPGTVDDQRSLPAIEAMEAAGIEIVVQEVANYNREEAFKVAEGMLTAHPDLDFIYAVSSDMAAAAVAAIEARNLVPGVDVGVWGFGGTVEELSAIIDGSQTGTAFRNPVEMGEAMALAITLVMDGRTDEVVTDYNATLYTLSSCEDVIRLVPSVTFGDEVPTIEDCN